MSWSHTRLSLRWNYSSSKQITQIEVIYTRCLYTENNIYYAGGRDQLFFFNYYYCYWRQKEELNENNLGARTKERKNTW